MFISGRIICGYSCGLGSVTLPVYAGEISTVKARGVMGAMNQLMTATGIFLASIVGIPLSYVPLWRINYAIVAIPAIIQALTMSFCVESPRYLISLNKIDEVKESLKKLRPNVCIQGEFYGMMEGQLGTTAAVNASSKDVGYFKGLSGNTAETPDPLPMDVDGTATSDNYILTPPLATPPPQYKEETTNQNQTVAIAMKMI